LLRICRLSLAGELEREPRLARTPGAGQGQQPRAFHERQQLSELVAAPHEGAGLRGQAGQRLAVRGVELGLELDPQLLDLLTARANPVLVAVLG